MRILYELIDTLPDNFIPDLPPRLTKLYLFVKKNKQLSEKQAATIYLEDSNKTKYFNILKSDLKKALILRLIATPSISTNKDKALIENCYRIHANYKIFLLNNKRETAIEMARSLLPKLQKLELYVLLYSVADDLLIHYSVIDFSVKRQKKYAALTKQALVDLNAYAQVREYYSGLLSICNVRESFSQNIIKKCIETVGIVEPLLQVGRHNTNRFIYIIIICRYTVVHDYENIIKYCDKALNSFPKNHPHIRSLSFMFLFNKTSALVPLGKLAEAKQVARDTLRIVPTGSFNWHLILLKRIVVCLHAGDFQEAYQLYKAHVKKKCPYPLITEYWNIIKGYLYFLIQVGLIEPYSKERFYLGKFLNEMPIYSKDKAGNNINILIIQILVQMRRGQFVKIIDRIDSLREYARLYTRNEETKRANIFIKMIIKMEAARFHRKGTETKTKTLLQKLKTTPLHMRQNLAIEVIPYVVLWEEVLLILDNKFRTTVVRQVQTNTPKKK